MQAPAPVWESVILGAIQGLTEFLPISSDGHLALTEMLFNFSSKGLALNVMLHVGTFVATLVMLWPRVRPALFDGLAACAKPSLFATVPGARDALVVILASIPTALMGLGLRHSVERWTESPLAVGQGLSGATWRIRNRTDRGLETAPDARGTSSLCLAIPSIRA